MFLRGDEVFAFETPTGLTDQSGNSHAITAAGGASAVENARFRGVIFDGVDDVLTLPLAVNQSFDGRPGLTFVVWVLTYPKVSSVILSLLVAGTSSKLYAEFSTTGFAFGGRSRSADSFQNASISISDAKRANYLQVAGVLDLPNDQIKIYCDGNLEVSQSVSFGLSAFSAESNTPVEIGAYRTVNGLFRGAIDSVWLYNSVLSDADLAAHYAATANPPISTGTAGFTGIRGVSRRLGT
jgi:hypothetical protein